MATTTSSIWFIAEYDPKGISFQGAIRAAAMSGWKTAGVFKYHVQASSTAEANPIAAPTLRSAYQFDSLMFPSLDACCADGTTLQGDARDYDLNWVESAAEN